MKKGNRIQGWKLRSTKPETKKGDNKSVRRRCGLGC